MNKVNVFTVILNTNRRDDTLACLAALHHSTYKRHTIIVLDNASTDGSAEAIKAEFPRVELIHLKENKGYAGNNNVGIAAAVAQGADWVYVLNEDTIQAPDCLDHLVAVGESDPTIGIVGPMVYHADNPDVIQSAGGWIDHHWQAGHKGQNDPDKGQFAEPHAVAWVSGCAIMVRREVIEQLGMLDEHFFYYWEETEWCVRTKRAGWKIMHVPQARLWHKGVQIDYRPGPNVAYYNTRNYLMMLRKHEAPTTVRLRAWYRILRTYTSMSLKPERKTNLEARQAMVQGMGDFWRGRVGKRKT
ncbi:MAG: glycosyltransferase family 2 protein [Chloroflexi bacterium]|nr:glycosyltransferase family 2 protein [Chloroflexota bacterium]